MPYDALSDLPDAVQEHLPKQAQEIYRAAINTVWEQYDQPQERRDGHTREETVHTVAWSAVERQYAMDAATGRWVKKGTYSMNNDTFEHHREDSLHDHATLSPADAAVEEQLRRQRMIRVASIAGMIALALAGIIALIITRRRPPTRLDRAEQALTNAAKRAEETAHVMRKRGPRMVERGALQIEAAARTVRASVPPLIEQKGHEIETFGATVRTRGPKLVISGTDRVEDYARSLRKQAPRAIAGRARQVEEAARGVRTRGPVLLRQSAQRVERVADRTRAVGAGVAAGAEAAAAFTRQTGAGIADQASEVAAGARRKLGRISVPGWR